MLRVDKEIKDKSAVESVIKKSSVCRIALSEGNTPYIVPMCFGYKDNCIYLHSACEGKKLSIIEKNNNVCFEFDLGVEVVKSENACGWGMKYYSVIGFGKAYLIYNSEEKRKALDIITEHYSDKPHHTYPEDKIDKTAVIKIIIESMTGKKSGY